MIRITVLQLLNAAPVLQLLSQQTHKGEVSFVMRRIAQKAQPEITNACAARDSLQDEFNSVPVDGGTRAFKPDFIAQLILDPLFSTIVEIDCAPLTPEMLASATISPAHLDALGPFLKEH
jgi:hypothetical protein